jgi:S-adenosylmethionine synthetase
VAKPLAVMVFTFGTSLLHEREILKIVEDNFDLRPGRIIK